MRSSDLPRQDGYILSVALIFILMFGLVLATSWFQRRLVETELLQQQLLARLEQELPREIQQVYAQARASGSAPSRQDVEAQAFINLHTRGRRQMVALETRRQEMKRLLEKRVDVRHQLSRLSLEVRRAQMWVLMLEQKLKTMPQVQRAPRSRLPHFGGTLMPSWMIASVPRPIAADA